MVYPKLQGLKSNANLVQIGKSPKQLKFGNSPPLPPIHVQYIYIYGRRITNYLLLCVSCLRHHQVNNFSYMMVLQINFHWFNSTFSFSESIWLTFVTNSRQMLCFRQNSIFMYSVSKNWTNYLHACINSKNLEMVFIK